MKKIISLISVFFLLVSCGNLNSNNNKMTKKVEKWNSIAVSYTGKLENWDVFDSTEKHGWEFLRFEAWAWQMIAGFDAWVIGMSLWETKNIEIEPKNAYGEYDENKKQTLLKKDLTSFTNAWFELKVWEKIPTQIWELEILASDDESITVDTNHPLAWKKLIFEVKIEEIN